MGICLNSKLDVYDPNQLSQQKYHVSFFVVETSVRCVLTIEQEPKSQPSGPASPSTKDSQLITPYGISAQRQVLHLVISLL